MGRDDHRMTRLDANDAARLPLTTDHAVQQRIADLLQGAIRRQWWTLYLDARDVQLPVIMPMVGYPDREWARGLSEACRAAGLSVRAQLILHDGGVRWFAPDDDA